MEQFINYLEQQVKNKSIYVWGAQGQQKITKEWIRSRETSKVNADRAIALFELRLSQGYGDVMRAFDCSGLGMYYLQNLKGIIRRDLTAAGMRNECDEITRSQLRKGDWVFRVNKSSLRTYHIGYVVDDSLHVIEAKGRADGVVRRTLNASSSTYWNAFGRPRCFSCDTDVFTFTRILKLSSPMMRGDDVKYAQILLSQRGFSCGTIDGIFGKDTRAAVMDFQLRMKLVADGAIGPLTAASMGCAFRGAGA